MAKEEAWSELNRIPSLSVKILTLATLKAFLLNMPISGTNRRYEELKNTNTTTYKLTFHFTSAFSFSINRKTSAVGLIPGISRTFSFPWTLVPGNFREIFYVLWAKKKIRQFDSMLEIFLWPKTIVSKLKIILIVIHRKISFSFKNGIYLVFTK